MKKLLLLFGFALFLSCGKENVSLVVDNITDVVYGASIDDSVKFFSAGGYKAKPMSDEQTMQSLNDIDFLKNAVEVFAHRITVETFEVQLFNKKLPVLTFFDYDQLFAQLIPYSKITRKQFETLVTAITDKIGAGEEHSDELALNFVWYMGSDIVMQLSFDLEQSTFILLAIDQSIRAANDVQLFEQVTIFDGWFIAGDLNSSYDEILAIENQNNFYASTATQEYLVYMAKLNDTADPIFYAYTFEDGLVQTIFFENIEGKEQQLVALFNDHFGIRGISSTQDIGGGFTLTTYIWEVSDNVGAIIFTYEQKYGDEVMMSQSNALISNDFNTIRNML